MTRRPALLVATVLVPVAGLLAAVVTDSGVGQLTGTFASPAVPSPPFVPKQELLSATWFCAGVPLVDQGVGDRGRGGVIVVANPLDTPLDALVTVFTSADEIGRAHV